MTQPRAQPIKISVKTFIDGIEDDVRRQDSRSVHKIMKDITGAGAKLWGTHIIGHGLHSVTDANGRDGQWFLTGFAPRKQGLTPYIMPGFKAYKTLLGKLGKHTIGKAKES